MGLGFRGSGASGVGVDMYPYLSRIEPFAVLVWAIYPLTLPRCKALNLGYCSHPVAGIVGSF